MPKQMIRLSGIAQQSVVNGKGLRKVFFSQGCSHHCFNCFNPNTWSFEGGQLFDVNTLVQQVNDESYLDGVTFSGGDPLEQPKSFALLARKLKENNINIWAYTGYTWEELIKLRKRNKHLDDLLHHIDVLVDGKYIEALHSEKHEYRGSSNQRLINVPLSLKTNKVVEITT